MNYTVLAYSVYLPIAVALTIWVARTLHTNSKVFLVDIFHGEIELAAAVNKLLQIGFYLISLGFAIIKLRIVPDWKYDEVLMKNVQTNLVDTQGTIEVLSYKLGAFILILGLMLFFNLFMLLILRAGTRPTQKTNFNLPQDVVIKGV
jgi:hypothetical protein